MNWQSPDVTSAAGFGGVRRGSCGVQNQLFTQVRVGAAGFAGFKQGFRGVGSARPPRTAVVPASGSRYPQWPNSQPLVSNSAFLQRWRRRAWRYPRIPAIPANRRSEVVSRGVDYPQNLRVLRVSEGVPA